MIICPHCQFKNKQGVMYCEDCGRRLKAADNSPTLPTRQVETSGDGFGPRLTWGTSRFDDNSSIVFQVQNFSNPITVPHVEQIILGRLDLGSPNKPDIDLTPFGALEKGVSRTHAAIFRSEDTLMLVDRNSANGTHLNGQKLIPHQARVLRNGDEIRLGKMIVHIYFKARND
jgi:hypothetical protein